MNLFNLEGKTAIVTGGNGGIGFGMAKGLGQAGARLIIAARNEAKTQSAVAELKDAGIEAAGIACDVTRLDDIEQTLQFALDTYGCIDILVNNAGVAGGGPPESIAEAVWDQVLDINLKSVFRFSQKVHPHMVKGGGGKIINIGSMYSLFGSDMVSPYAASKGGVIQLTKSLAVSWAKDNIQVNAVLPGWITTDMTAPVKELPASYEGIIARTPAGRFGEIEDMAGAAVFLASRGSDFVTGISLPVCGGYSIS